MRALHRSYAIVSKDEVPEMEERVRHLHGKVRPAPLVACSGRA